MWGGDPSRGPASVHASAQFTPQGEILGAASTPLLMAPVVGVELSRSISYGPDSSAWLAGSGSDVISDSGTPRSFPSQVQTLNLISAFLVGLMPGTR